MPVVISTSPMGVQESKNSNMFDASDGKGLRQWVGRVGLIGEPFYRSSEYSFETVKRLGRGFQRLALLAVSRPCVRFFVIGFSLSLPFEKDHIIVTCKCTSIVGQYHKNLAVS